MKRSKSVRRMLLGGFSAGAIVATLVAAERVTPESYYTNDYFLPGAGYYHAPFRGFYSQPYNHYDAGRKMYFFGGQWAPAPHRSIVNISAPTAEAAQRAEALRTDVSRNVSRGGFGHTSGSHYIHS
jgi:hypothetical protein